MNFESAYPTKNDGQEVYYEYQDIIYDKLDLNLAEKFKHVKSASFTLDKVTVSRILYTVLLTYFFWEGKINCVLNSITVK